MKEIFGDTSYFVAVFNPGDQWHSEAIEVERNVGPFELVTTDFIILEVANYFSRSRSDVKEGIVNSVRAMFEDDSIKIIKCTHEAALNGLDLYEARSDKSYSLTDCISMNVIRERGIHEVLTHDRNFKQEGFLVLL